MKSLICLMLCVCMVLPFNMVCAQELPLDLVAKRTEATAFVAGVVADVTSGTVTPAPAPAPAPDNPDRPEPGSKCQTCNGSGTVYPDGRIARKCDDCGGDGKMSIGDFEQLQARSIGQTIQPDPSVQPNIWTPAKPDTADTADVADVAEPVYQKINWRTNGTEAKRLTEQTGKLAIIYFYAKEGCVGCERYEQTHFKDQDVVQELNENFVCLKSDVRKLTPYKLRAWGITKLPTIVIADSKWNGKGEQIPFTLNTDLFIWHLRAAYGGQRTQVDSLNVHTATYRKGSMRVIRVTGDISDEAIQQTPIQIGSDDYSNGNGYARSNGSAGGYGARSNGSNGGAGGYSGYARGYARGNGNGSAGGYAGYSNGGAYQAAPVVYYESAPVVMPAYQSAPVAYYGSSGGSNGGAGGMYSSGGSSGGTGGMARAWNSMWGGGGSYSSYPTQYASYGSSYGSSGSAVTCYDANGNLVPCN